MVTPVSANGNGHSSTLSPLAPPFTLKRYPEPSNPMRLADPFQRDYASSILCPTLDNWPHDSSHVTSTTPTGICSTTVDASVGASRYPFMTSGFGVSYPCNPYGYAGSQATPVNVKFSTESKRGDEKTKPCHVQFGLGPKEEVVSDVPSLACSFQPDYFGGGSQFAPIGAKVDAKNCYASSLNNWESSDRVLSAGDNISPQLVQGSTYDVSTSGVPFLEDNVVTKKVLNNWHGKYDDNFVVDAQLGSGVIDLQYLNLDRDLIPGMNSEFFQSASQTCSISPESISASMPQFLPWTNVSSNSKSINGFLNQESTYVTGTTTGYQHAEPPFSNPTASSASNRLPVEVTMKSCSNNNDPFSLHSIEPVESDGCMLLKGIEHARCLLEANMRSKNDCDASGSSEAINMQLEKTSSPSSQPDIDPNSNKKFGSSESWANHWNFPKVSVETLEKPLGAGQQETEDQFVVVVDSPCWKGAPAFRGSQFDSADDISVSSSKESEVSDQAHPVFDQRILSPCHELNNLIPIEKGSAGNPSLSLTCGIPSKTMQLHGEQYPPSRNNFSSGKRAASEDTKAGEVSGKHSSLLKRSELEAATDNVLLELKNTEASQILPERLPSDLALKNTNAAMDSFSNLFSQPTGYNLNSSPPGIGKSAVVGENPIETQLSRTNNMKLINAMHSLSEVLLANCSSHPNIVEKLDFEVLQLVLDNLDSILKLSSKIPALHSPSQCSYHQTSNVILPKGPVAGSDVPGLLEVDACKMPNRGDSTLNLNGFSMKPEMMNQKFDAHVSCDRDKSVAEYMENLMKKNFNGKEEKNLQAQLYKNLWIEAEAALCAMKYEVRLTRMNSELEKSNDDSRTGTPGSSNGVSTSGETQGLNETQIGLQADKGTNLSSKDPSTVQVDERSKLIERLKILNQRRERTNEHQEALSGLMTCMPNTNTKDVHEGAQAINGTYSSSKDPSTVHVDERSKFIERWKIHNLRRERTNEQQEAPGLMTCIPNTNTKDVHEGAQADKGACFSSEDPPTVHDDERSVFIEKIKNLINQRRNEQQEASGFMTCIPNTNANDIHEGAGIERNGNKNKRLPELPMSGIRPHLKGMQELSFNLPVMERNGNKKKSLPELPMSGIRPHLKGIQELPFMEPGKVSPKAEQYFSAVQMHGSHIWAEASRQLDMLKLSSEWNNDGHYSPAHLTTAFTGNASGIKPVASTIGSKKQIGGVAPLKSPSTESSQEWEHVRVEEFAC